MKNVCSSYGVCLILCTVFSLAACQKTSERNVKPAFYHWKSTLNISKQEEIYLKTISTHRIYLRFFDVDWDGTTDQPLPIAELEIKSDLSDSIEIVPTVFITNRTFLNLPANEVSELVNHVVEKILKITSNFLSHQIREIQFDCDWSPKTQLKYFTFLKEIRSKIQRKSILLSSTIRLHQIKFFEKTGVPPVDRGVLMFYNMGNVEDVNAKNSILDLSIAKQYLENFENYPLAIDVALPIFSWGVLIREGRMINLINNLQASDLKDELRFLKIDETHFEIIKSTYLQGHYLYKGDVLRLEMALNESLQESADLLSNLIQNTDLTVIFYHLDSIAINNYPHEILEDICNRFR